MAIRITEDMIADMQAKIKRRDEMYEMYKKRIPGRLISEKFGITKQAVSAYVKEAREAERRVLEQISD